MHTHISHVMDSYVNLKVGSFIREKKSWYSKCVSWWNYERVELFMVFLAKTSWVGKSKLWFEGWKLCLVGLLKYYVTNEFSSVSSVVQLVLLLLLLYVNSLKLRICHEFYVEKILAVWKRSHRKEVMSLSGRERYDEISWKEGLLVPSTLIWWCYSTIFLM